MRLDEKSYPWGIACASLGMHPAHTLEKKFQAIKNAGFSNCEIGLGEYCSWVRSQVPSLPPSTCPPEWSEGGEPDPSDDEIWEAMYSQASILVKLAESFGLKILMLQPLNQFDGWPDGHKRKSWAYRKAERWLTTCSKVGVEQIQVGSNDYAEASASDEETANDLAWLAEFAANLSPPVKIAYESWCFSERVQDWEHTWKIVQLANHPNLGLCMDTAQFPLAKRYGWDPKTGTGWSEEQYQDMLERIRQIPGEKIFYIELSECIAPSTPLYSGSRYDAWAKNSTTTRNDRFIWAICGRPVPLIGLNAGQDVQTNEDMGGARVVETLLAILSTGYKGPMMFEFFEAENMERGDLDIPNLYAQACARSKVLLLEKLQN